MKMLFPDASNRSPTAVPGKSDVRDENVYSAAAVNNTGAGNTTVFTNPRGQSIPSLGTAPTQAHQKTYTELTTNISQSGQLGSAIGEASVRAMGISIEEAQVSAAGVVSTSYGASQADVNEILSKTFFQFRIGGKLQIQGPSLFFPSLGNAMGSVSTTANASSAGYLTNGVPGSGRKLKVPVLVGRTDTIEGTFGVAGGATLTLAAPSLIWFNLLCLVKGDAR